MHHACYQFTAPAELRRPLIHLSAAALCSASLPFPTHFSSPEGITIHCMITATQRGAAQRALTALQLGAQALGVPPPQLWFDAGQPENIHPAPISTQERQRLWQDWLQLRPNTLAHLDAALQRVWAPRPAL